MKKLCGVWYFVLLVSAILNNRSPLQAQALIPQEARHGMVVSTQTLASEAGLGILRQGGNAIDAAIATAFVLAVVYPSCGNIGGEGFLLYYGSNGQSSAIDFRLQAPASVTPEMFLDESGKNWGKSPVEDLHITDSPLAIGIPGTVAGLALAHRRFGTIPWAQLLEPAVRLAEHGFPVSLSLHKEMADSREFFKNYLSSVRFFLKVDGSVYEPGEIWKQHDLAQTLKRIQRQGAEEFYRGRTAELIVAGIRQNGGIITLEDLKNYRAIERRPDHSTYRGWDIFAMPLPSSGGITQTEILNIMEGYDLQALGQNSAQYLHLLTEAMRRSYRDRDFFLGDPDFNPQIPKERLMSKTYADELRKGIDPQKASKSSDLDLNLDSREKMETTHFSVVDSQGNAVSVTYTLNGDFGSYLVPEGSGVILNNS
ncbi:MAG: gamma-glutamyltransferase, partial [Planctomycetales bacterium]|nr:gamma-glutamyltransferase [Planctomycetales bacterium]